MPANLTTAAMEDQIVAWRKRLAEDGLDAGARTIAWHLGYEEAQVPALSTIHRVLRRRGFVIPQPQKRPRSSWACFESDLPNETWQSDMTHWHLDEQPVEIVNFIDDYSRGAGQCGAARRHRSRGGADLLRNCSDLRASSFSALR